MCKLALEDAPYPITGKERHLKGVVPWNVKLALEAHRDPAFATLPDLSAPTVTTQGVYLTGNWINVTDQHDNVRPDGSADGIFSHRSKEKNYCELTMRDGKVLHSAVAFIKERGLPQTDLWVDSRGYDSAKVV